jgi:hypothetical protein
VNWLWLGSLLFLIGIVVAAWPEKEVQRSPVKAKVRAQQPSAAD